MKRIIPVLFGGLALVGLTVSCSKEAPEAAAKAAITVKAMVVQKSDRTVARTYTGTLEGEQQASIYSRLAESVDKVQVRVGDRVRVDQVLISLDKYGPTSRYNEAQAPYLNAEKYYKKMEHLFAQGAVSETEYDAARTSYETAKASFDAVARTVDVRSPIDGEVTSVDVAGGDFVQVGQKLATVARTDKLRVRFGVNPDEIGAFRLGHPVLVTSELLPDSLTGSVVKVARSADPVTRTFEVEALVDNPGDVYKPGVFVRVAYTLDHLNDVIAVPRKAVVNLDGRMSVYTASNGVASLRQVTLGEDLLGDVVIRSGLQPGDTLVTLGQDYLSDGDAVTVLDAKETD